jgi:hypothetical protein
MSINVCVCARALQTKGSIYDRELLAVVLQRREMASAKCRISALLRCALCVACRSSGRVVSRRALPSTCCTAPLICCAVPCRAVQAVWKRYRFRCLLHSRALKRLVEANKFNYAASRIQRCWRGYAECGASRVVLGLYNAILRA